jgi:hypothetical protein
MDNPREMKMTSKIEKTTSMEDAIKNLFDFEDDKERLDFEAKQIHLQIMFKIKDLMDKKGWGKADLASRGIHSN